MDDLDDRLRRRQAVHDVLSDGLVFDGRHELADYLERDVRFQQRHTHFAQRQLDVLFAQPPLATEAVKDGLEFF